MKCKEALKQSDVEQLYELRQAIAHGDQLSPFCRSTTVGECTILGLDSLYAEVHGRVNADVELLRHQYTGLLHRYEH